MDLSLSMSQQLTTSTVLTGWLHSDKVRGTDQIDEGQRERGGGEGESLITLFVLYTGESLH